MPFPRRINLPIHYGAHCYLFTDGWSDDHLHILDTARMAGMDVFEVVVGDDISYTPRLTHQRAKSLGLALTVSPGGFWPADCDLSADDPADRARGLAWHKRQVNIAAELGAVAYTGALYGHPGTVLRRLPPADELLHTAEGLHALAEYGARRGVAVVIEPMSHFRTHLINTPEQAMHLVTLADHPNLRVLLDTYHLVTEVRDYAQAIHTVAPKLWGLHACESDRGVPGGGLVPWNTVFAALKAIDFEGYVLLETYNSSIGDPPGTFAYQRGMFHDPCPDGKAFAQQGIAFLKAGMEKP
jgi:D-psicose/D-tagatose/L-ribulose 3-epimerase